MSAHNQETILFCIALVVQAAAILSVVIARLGQREQSQLRYERFFFACMALVATICLVGTWTGTGSWMLNGFTITTMALGATIDFGSKATSSGV